MMPFAHDLIQIRQIKQAKLADSSSELANI